MDIGGIGLGGINARGDEGKDFKVTEQAKLAQEFNPGAQVIPSQGAQAALASMARLQMKNGKRISDESEEIKAKDEAEIEVATLGMMKLSDEQLQGFREKIEHAILRQEREILDTVNTFAGNEKTLRKVIGSLLLNF